MDAARRLDAALSGRYAIEREIGAGGMATVYLARDLKHNRKVALKVLNAELGAVLGTERFLSEIETTANLQHPHLLPLFDSGEAGGLLFYVMPYVEGESLRARLERERQVPVEEAVRIATAVASALDYAHRHDVIHRDLKPENILLHDGQPVIADFGIALAVSKAGGARITQTGLSLGTPQYMSPEQATGDRVLDARTDIYSLASVLYEMLTGEPPHTASTSQAIIARVLTEAPRPIRASRPNVPVHVEAAVLKSLEKLPADRFASAGELVRALGDASFRHTTGLGVSVGGADAVPLVLRGWKRATAGLAAVAVLATALAAWGWLRAPPHPPPPIERFELNFPRGFVPAAIGGPSIAVSPDGSRIVYVGTDSTGARWLYARGIGERSATQLAGTRGALQPFFSPDGEWVAFSVAGGTMGLPQSAGRLYRVSLVGRGSVPIAELPRGLMGGGSWGAGDTIIFSDVLDLYRVAASGGRPERIATRPAGRGLVYYRFPELLPDGRHVVFTQMEGASATLAVLSLEDGVVRSLEQPGVGPRWVDGGFLTFVQADGTLFAAPFDARRARFRGSPEPIVQNVMSGVSQGSSLGVSRSGVLAFLTGSGTAPLEVVMVDRQGRVERLPLPPAAYAQPRLSPDGRRLAVTVRYAIGTAASGDAWVGELSGRGFTRVTYDSMSLTPEWLPDGRRISVNRAGSGVGLYAIATDGSGTTDTIMVRPTATWEVQYTPDGRRMAFRETVSPNDRDIWIAPVDTPASARPFIRTPYNEWHIALSHDGRRLAWVSNETGAEEVYIRAFEESGPRWRVSTAGGREPRWSPDGRELFYRTGDSLMVVRIGTADEPDIGAPRLLFTGRFASSATNIWYDVHPDGNRFVFLREPSEGESAPALHVLLHWFDQRRARRSGR